MSLLHRKRKQRFGAAFPFIAMAIRTTPGGPPGGGEKNYKMNNVSGDAAKCQDIFDNNKVSLTT
jgi:hypothetical protein